jgi:phage tail sheath protein FI
MATYSAPGVYTNESDETLDPIGGTGDTSCVVVIESTQGPANKRLRFSNISQYFKTFGYPNPTIGDRGYKSQLSAIAALRGCNRTYVTRVANGALYGGCTLLREPTTSQILFNSLQPFGLEDVTGPSFELTDDVIMGIYSYAPGESDIKIRLEPNTTTIDGGFWLNVYNPSSSLVPVKYNVSLIKRTNQLGEQMYVEDFINNKSKDIIVRVNSRFSGTLSDSLITASKVAFFAGGSNGVPVTDQQVIAGYELYRAADSAPIDIFVNAGWDGIAVKQALLSMAAQSKAIAVIDGPLDIEHDAQMLVDYRNNTLNADTRHGMFTVPYITCNDSYNNMKTYVPSSGFIAAVMARSDYKANKWTSPAGMTRGDISLGSSQTSNSALGIIGLRTTYDQDAQGMFAENQISPILNFSGQGIKLFGDYTLQTRKSMFQFLNVSRMFNHVINTAKNSLLFANFDPNNDILRQKVKAQLEAITAPIKATNGLESYSIICDASNNPTETTTRGELHAYLGLTPIGSARAIILDAALTKNSVSISILS